MEQQHNDRALQARVRQQAIVADLGRRALAGGGLDELLQYATSATMEALGASLAKVVECTGEQGILRVGAGRLRDAKPGPLPAGATSQLGFVTAARQPVLIDDLRTETRFTPDPMLRQHGAISGISVAIAGSGEAWGVFGVHDVRRRSFDADDVYFVHSVANVLADAIGQRRAAEALQESEARSRAVLDTTVDAIITIDERGHILSFNRAAERIFGFVAEEVRGKNVSVLMPEPYHSEHDGYIASYRETGRRKIIGIGREVTGQRKDGTTFPMDLAVSEVEINGKTTFTGIVRDISERRRLELEVLRISDEERRRIGQDLHDGLGQQLTGIGLIARSLTRNLAKAGSPAAETADEITTLIHDADEQARRLARGLVPVELGVDGLPAALHRLAANATHLFGIECVFEPGIESYELLHSPEQASHLYRIAQEALRNAVRHGQAERVVITLTAGSERLRLRILDDGTGIPDGVMAAGHDGTSGMGLNIMNYRARIIGGSLDVRSGPDGGTVVTCTLPPSSDASAIRGARNNPHSTSRPSA